MVLLLVQIRLLSRFCMKLSDSRHYRTDRMALKGFVAFLLYVEPYTLLKCLNDNGVISILDTLQTILCTYSIYW